MKKNVLILVAVALVLVVVGVVWLRMMADPPAKGGDLALLIDNSSSETLNCASVAALAGVELGEITLGKASHLEVFTLGNEDSSFEPKLVLDLPLKRGAGGIRKAKRAVEKACGDFGTVTSSSIFRGTELVLAQLQTRGLSGSRFVLDSDLEENVDARLPKARKKTAALLNNSGINSLLCGVASTNRGGPRGPHADSLVKAWLGNFAEPKRVTVEPFCPGEGNIQRASR